jgi:hypothetical protein
MPTVEGLILAFELAQIGAGTRQQIIEAIQKLSQNASAILTKCMQYASDREVLADIPPVAVPLENFVFSPVMRALETIYCNDGAGMATGKVYVMHAPPSSGKTIGDREYLQGYLSALEGVDTPLGKAHGIMFTGTGDYFV